MTIPRPFSLPSFAAISFAAISLGAMCFGAMCLGVPGLAGPAAAEPNWRPGPRGDLVFETSDFLRTTSYSKPARTADQFDDDGAYGPLNRSWNASRKGRWLIEEQRNGFDAIAAGLSYNRQDLVVRGEKILNWGFARQRPDGSFDCPNHWHSTALFVEAAAHAVMLLQVSKLRDQNQDWIEEVKPKLRQAVLWMMAPENAGAARAADEPYADRFFLNADAVGEVGVLLHDDAMVKAARGYVRAGLAHLDPSGFAPENGGPDTSYHAASLLYAMNYYTLVANEDMRQQLQPKISWALAWFDGKVRSDGTVDQTGNIRTGQERAPQGGTRTMNYTAAYSAAFYWYMITGEDHWAQLAQLLYEGQRVELDQHAAASR